MTAPALPFDDVVDQIATILKREYGWELDPRVKIDARVREKIRTAIRAALDKRGEVSPAAGASARALGGDGEPVARRTGWDVIGPTGIVFGSPSRAECESAVARLNAIEAGSSCPVRYTVAPHYEPRPAATGARGVAKPRTDGEASEQGAKS